MKDLVVESAQDGGTGDGALTLMFLVFDCCCGRCCKGWEMNENALDMKFGRLRFDSYDS